MNPDAARQLTALTPTRRRLSNRRRGKPRIHRLWLPWFSLDGTKGQPLGRSTLPPPATSTLEDVLSICYQATLLREEGRPVTFACRSARLMRSRRPEARPLASIVWCLRAPYPPTSTNSEGLLPLSCFPDR